VTPITVQRKAATWLE